MDLHGCLTAVVTPFDNGGLDEESFARIVKWQSSSGISGLVVSGSTGEGVTVSADERKRLLTLARENVAAPIPIIAGVSSNSTQSAIEQSQKVGDEGADLVLHVTGYYNRPTQDQIVSHYCAVAESSPVPIIVYNIPSRTGINIDSEAIVKLSQHSNIVGVKDSTGDLGRVSYEFNAASRPFSFVSGDDPSCLAYIAMGGHACIAVASNICPKLFSSLIDAAQAGDLAKARKINGDIGALNRLLYLRPNPAPLKYILSKLGVCRPDLRSPLDTPPEEVQSAIDRGIEQLPIDILEETRSFRS